MLTTIEKNLRSPHTEAGLLLNSVLAFPIQNETAGSMKDKIIPIVMDEIKRDQTALLNHMLVNIESHKYSPELQKGMKMLLEVYKDWYDII